MVQSTLESPAPRIGRRARPRGIGIAAGLLALLAAQAAPPRDTGPAVNPEETIRSWVNGPVRYLMTGSEYEEIQAIKSVPELARFITDFWLRRDPTPSTFENEYRREFWDRVIEANHRFRDSTTPGWKTDRGKVFILLGEPIFIEADEHPKNTSGYQRLSRGPGAPDAGYRGIERWHYGRQYSAVAAPEFVAVFVRDESYDWKLSTNEELLSPSFTPASTSSLSDPAFAAFARIITGGRPNTRTPTPGWVTSMGMGTALAPPTPADVTNLPLMDAALLANYDLGLELAVPSNAELMIASVSARDFLSGFIATPAFEFFRAADGSTFVNMGALIRTQDLFGDLKEGSAEVRIYTSLTNRNDPAAVHYATNEKAPARFATGGKSTPGGLLDVWAGLNLAPGRYVVTIAIEESLAGRLGRCAAEIDVPDYSQPGLAMSTPVLASEITDARGRLGVTARISRVFARSESFGVYYEVYGFKGADGRPGFDTSYNFYRENAGSMVQIGKPTVFSGRTQSAQAWSFPLAGWPPGRYMVQVTASIPAGESVSAVVPFEVLE